MRCSSRSAEQRRQCSLIAILRNGLERIERAANGTRSPLVGDCRRDERRDVLGAQLADQTLDAPDHLCGLRCAAGELTDRRRRARPADSTQRQERIVLQRPLQLARSRNPVDGVDRAMATQRFDHGAAEEVEAAANLSDHRALHRRIAAERRESADERGSDELRLLGLQAP